MRSWRRSAYRAVRPILFAADAETVHQLTVSALGLAGRAAAGRALCALASDVPSLSERVEVMGLTFRNRIGLAAGFDKDGVAIRGWAALGFGFVELGTVTPRPQRGNARPRLFRLTADEALINRMGFNNAGADALARRIADARPHLPHGFVIGVNIGRNRDGDVGDYPAAARAVAGVADYIAINVSSPNTPRLRDLQQPARLVQLLAAVADAAPRPPLLVKLSPDMSSVERRAIIGAVRRAGVAGAIVSNTSTSRAALKFDHAAEEGGLSGRPLAAGTLAAVEAATAAQVTVVASGGIGSDADVSRLRAAGADLFQLWTGMVYAGPGLIGEAVRAAD